MLLDNSNKTDGIVKDVEKKFANSVKMASEFRNVIEIKEDQVTIYPFLLINSKGYFSNSTSTKTHRRKARS